MPERHFLIHCTSSRGREHELDRWLSGRISSLRPMEAALYRPSARLSLAAAETEAEWVVELHSDGVPDRRQIQELLAEMRLLGLAPELFATGAPAKAKGLSGGSRARRVRA